MQDERNRERIGALRENADQRDCSTGANGLERAAQLGNLVAVQALESPAPQEYKLAPAELASRCAVSYGEAAATDIAAHIS